MSSERIRNPDDSLFAHGGMKFTLFYGVLISLLTLIAFFSVPFAELNSLNMDVNYKDFRLLGDIYISIDKCYEQALEYGHSKVREICFLATHGILHLLGYDHMEKEDEEKMFKLQEELLLGFDIKR